MHYITFTGPGSAYATQVIESYDSPSCQVVWG
jgi:hypothetical protein